MRYEETDLTVGPIAINFTKDSTSGPAVTARIESIAGALGSVIPTCCQLHGYTVVGDCPWCGNRRLRAWEQRPGVPVSIPGFKCSSCGKAGTLWRLALALERAVAA